MDRQPTKPNSLRHDLWKAGLLSWLLLITDCIQTGLPLDKFQGAFYNILYVENNLMTSAMSSFRINHEHDWILSYSLPCMLTVRAELIDPTLLASDLPCASSW